MSFVLDSSATMAWVYPDETTPAIRELIERISSTGAWVPPLWYLEVGNTLQTGVRRGRINPDIRSKTLADLGSLLLRIDTETTPHAWRNTLRLSDVHRLTLYDAVYLELALRRELPLATLDRALRVAAEAEHILLLGL